MQCIILRNCFVKDRYYTKGEAKEVPDELVKEHPKNFRPVEEPLVEEPATDASEKPPERLHKHYYRKDGTCVCGAVLSAGRMKTRERKAKKKEVLK